MTAKTGQITESKRALALLDNAKTLVEGGKRSEVQLSSLVASLQLFRDLKTGYTFSSQLDYPHLSRLFSDLDTMGLEAQLENLQSYYGSGLEVRRNRIKKALQRRTELARMCRIVPEEIMVVAVPSLVAAAQAVSFRNDPCTCHREFLSRTALAFLLENIRTIPMPWVNDTENRQISLLDSYKSYLKGILAETVSFAFVADLYHGQPVEHVRTDLQGLQSGDKKVMEQFPWTAGCRIVPTGTYVIAHLLGHVKYTAGNETALYIDCSGEDFDWNETGQWCPTFEVDSEVRFGLRPIYQPATLRSPLVCLF